MLPLTTAPFSLLLPDPRSPAPAPPCLQLFSFVLGQCFLSMLCAMEFG